MAIPIANFNLSKTALSVQFNQLSLNNPTSWAWDFGDGTVDTVANPLKVYTSEGYYVVSLIATNSDGSSVALELSVGVSNTNATVGNYSIWFMSEQEIPVGLRDQIENNEKHSMISTWQKYLYPIIPDDITKPADPIDTHQEMQYDCLINELIAKLVAYELIIQAANQFTSGSTMGATASISSSTSDLQVKKIQTGPANVEWHPDTTSDDSDSAAGAVSAATKAGGSLDQLKAIICQLSKRLRIYLPMCGQLEHSPIPVSKKTPAGTTTAIWPSFVPVS